MISASRYRIQIPLPPKIDPSVTMMTVEDGSADKYRFLAYHFAVSAASSSRRISRLEFRVQEKPDVTYNDVGGAKEQLERLREAPTINSKIALQAMS